MDLVLVAWCTGELVVGAPLVSELLALLGDVGVGVVEALLVFGFELVAEPLRVS
jgi:hypothetical protein